MEETSKYFIIDNVIIGNNHVINNSGCINIVQNIDNKEASITFFADASHIESVRNKVTAMHGKTVHYSPINVIDPARSPLKKAISWIRKIKEDDLFIDQLFKKAKSEQPAFILFCTLTAINLYLYLGKIRKNNKQKTIIGLHGEIEYLFKSNPSLKDKANAFLYRKAFQNSPDNLKYLVLSPLIKEKLTKSGLLVPQQLLCIEHPISTYKPIVKTSVPEKPIFALLGVASLRKNAQQIFNVAKGFQQDIENQKAEFQVIGKVASDTQAYVNEQVILGSTEGKPLAQDDYERLINASTYSLSFITGNEYTLRISGSLIDSIQYQIPIIALQHEFIAHIFREAGDIGFICNDIEEMKALIARIISRNEAVIGRYQQQVKNLEHYSQRFSEPTNASVLKSQLVSCGWAENA
jgi:glycosyltransferase involved in cell wall biosynthesis